MLYNTTVRFCECGGIGRRARLRTVWATLQVRVLSLAPIKFGFISIDIKSDFFCNKDLHLIIDTYKDEDNDHICDICSEIISQHIGMIKDGMAATIEHAGYKSYYQCDCERFLEDEDCSIEIVDIEAWKAEGGNGYLPKLVEQPSPDTGTFYYMAIYIIMISTLVLLVLVYILSHKKESK